MSERASDSVRVMIEMPLFIKWRCVCVCVCVCSIKFNKKSQDPPSLIRGKSNKFKTKLSAHPPAKVTRLWMAPRPRGAVRSLPAGLGMADSSFSQPSLASDDESSGLFFKRL